MKYIWIILTSVWLVSCQQTDPTMLAQVGESKLTVHDVLLQMPLTCSGPDSALFVQEHVDAWINEQLLYQQGLKNVPNLEELERQAEQYRRDLIARTYQSERLAIYSEEVTAEECMAFYESCKSHLKLEYPIIQGLYVKVLANSSKVSSIKTWLKEIQDGKMDHAEELEQFCQQRAVDYDSFTEEWVDMRRLTDRLPVKVYDSAQFLHRQVYQQKDKEYVYLFLISDFHLAGEIQPYEFCHEEIHNMMIQQKQENYRKKLQQDLRDEALRTGLLKLN